MCCSLHSALTLRIVFLFVRSMRCMPVRTGAVLFHKLGISVCGMLWNGRMADDMLWSLLSSAGQDPMNLSIFCPALHLGAVCRPTVGGGAVSHRFANSRQAAACSMLLIHLAHVWRDHDVLVRPALLPPQH